MFVCVCYVIRGLGFGSDAAVLDVSRRLEDHVGVGLGWIVGWVIWVVICRVGRVAGLAQKRRVSERCDQA